MGRIIRFCKLSYEVPRITGTSRIAEAGRDLRPGSERSRPHRLTKRKCRTGCKTRHSSLAFQPNPGLLT